MRIGASVAAAQQRILSSLDAARAAAAVGTLGRVEPQGRDRPSEEPATVQPIQALARDQAAVQAGILRAFRAASFAVDVSDADPGEN